MRLLDLIAQCSTPKVLIPSGNAPPITVSGPYNFAQQIVACPLRYVMADNLTRASAELAFADGDRLAGCLDLLRFPASTLWVEWSDSIHQQVICECGSAAHGDPNATGRRVGVFLRASCVGRSALVRTFWTALSPSGTAEAQMSPVETYIDLDDRFAPCSDASRMLSGEYVSVTDHRDRGVADLLQRTRFRLDERWLKYYQAAAPDVNMRDAIARKSLAAIAHDTPLLLGFLLLLNAKGATQPQPIQRNTLNRKRLAHDRAPLLDHIEVHASLPGHVETENPQDRSVASRHPPRLHHVRGHLVRREDRIFWRIPHLRGSALQGLVRSRTVCLSFARA